MGTCSCGRLQKDCLLPAGDDLFPPVVDHGIFAIGCEVPATESGRSSPEELPYGVQIVNLFPRIFR